MGLVQEFKEFAIKGNAMDMAVGIVIGAAFTKIVNSIVSDLIMPPIGLLVSDGQFKDWKIVLREKTMEGDKVVTPEVGIMIGNFVDTVIQFLIIAIAVFIVIKVLNRVLETRGSFIPGLGKKS
ncbi:MAG: large conductance mechanosensitive channel protein MscL [Phycisphaerae bacterium]|nr:large conductance mechanosensitive channel protein MscL [Phycisphaerae bacterium]